MSNQPGPAAIDEPTLITGFICAYTVDEHGNVIPTDDDEAAAIRTATEGQA